MSQKKIISFIIFILIGLSVIFVWKNSQKPQIEEESVRDQIFSIISDFNFNDPKSFYSISDIGDLGGEETLVVLQELIKSKSVSDRWAAIVLLPKILKNNDSFKEEVFSSLRYGLNDENDTLKMLTGAQLISLGEKDGLPALISSLNSNKTTHFGEPPELVKDRSLIYLHHYTNYNGEVFDEWQKWWDNNKELLFWNESLEIFEIK